MLNIAICDDVYNEIASTRYYLEEYLKENNMLATIDIYDSGTILLKNIMLKNYDVVFLDIVMPIENGITIAKEIRKVDSRIIIVLVSNTSEYALEGYSVSALYYGLKPLTNKKMSIIMERVNEKIECGKGTSVILKTLYGYEKIDLKNVILAESNNKQVHIKLGNEEKICKNKLDFVEVLFGNGFVRIHKSYLVNLRYIKAITQSKVVLENDECLPISRSYKESTLKSYIAYVEEGTI